MIITRTPMRISLVGGGTDMPAFYEHHDGAVISMGINKYVYVAVNPKFDGRIRVSYSKTENVDHIDEIQHDIVREVLKMFNFHGVEVVSVSDIPSEGSGLGSSSAFTVGLLRAMYPKSYRMTPKILAENAFMVESKICGHPVGKQDHYAAAFGGLNFFEFKRKDVYVEDFDLKDEELRAIGARMMLFWTGLTRKSDTILKEQETFIQPGHRAAEAAMLTAELARQLKSEMDNGHFGKIGKCVKAAWKLKKTFADGISAEWIDLQIKNALEEGAEGAKICGAGGGGFLLVIANPKFHDTIENSVDMKRIPFKINAKGSCVIHSEET